MNNVTEVMNFRTRFNHKKCGKSFNGGVGDYFRSRTKQSEKDGADLNLIVDRYMKTGQLPQASSPGAAPIFRSGDFTQFNDFQKNCDLVNAAREAFMQLPSSLRDRLGNNPANFESWINDPRNEKEAIKLGLKQRVRRIPQVEIVNSNPIAVHPNLEKPVIEETK